MQIKRSMLKNSSKQSSLKNLFLKCLSAPDAPREERESRWHRFSIIRKIWERKGPRNVTASLRVQSISTACKSLRSKFLSREQLRQKPWMQSIATRVASHLLNTDPTSTLMANQVQEMLKRQRSQVAGTQAEARAKVETMTCSAATQI